MSLSSIDSIDYVSNASRRDKADDARAADARNHGDAAGGAEHVAAAHPAKDQAAAASDARDTVSGRGAPSTMKLDDGKSAPSHAVAHDHVDAYSGDVKAMQQRMKDAGIDPGPVDGLKGPLTRAAMAQYEAKFHKSAAEGLKVDPGFAEKAGSSHAAAGHPRDGAAPGADRGGSIRGTVGRWIDKAKQVLEAHGISPSKLSSAAIATIIKHESGGNPNSVNRWDSNARAGHPSKGLMQTIASTFNSFKLPGHDDIFNPVDNIIAGVRYALSRYGSLSNVPGIRSLAHGGRYRGY